jgi:hypothetical protein
LPSETELLQLVLDDAAILGAEQLVSAILSDCNSVNEELMGLGREIEQIASAISRTAQVAGDGGQDERDNAKGMRARLLAALKSKLVDIASAVDARLQCEYIVPQGGLAAVVMNGGRPRALLAAKLHELSREAVRKALAGVNVLEETGGTEHANGSGLRTALTLATPPLLQFGGSRRVLAVVPRDSRESINSAEFSTAVGAPVTLVSGNDNGLTICVEASGLSLPHVALDLVEGRRDRVEFAERVHCRTDIKWVPVVSPAAAPVANSWSEFEARQTQQQHAICKTMVT